MTLNEIIAKVSKESGIPQKIVDRTYRAYWRAIREHITSLPLKKDLTDEEFMKLQPNINIPSIGKLSVTLDRYHRIKKSYNKFIELKKKDNAAHKKS